MPFRLDDSAMVLAKFSTRLLLMNAALRFIGVTVFALLFMPRFFAQNSAPSGTVSEAESLQHLKQKVDPVYPPIAKAAQVQGDVVLSISIDTKGNVASEKVLSGPAMLQQAAMDAVKKWQFAPFAAGGASTQATTTNTIPFHLPGPQLTPDQDRAAQAWFPLSDQCRSALKAQNKDDSLNYCKQTLDISLKAGDLTSSDQLGRVISYQYYGHALLMAGRAQEALEQENLAVTEAKKCVTDKDEEYAEPFFWRAIVEANLGDTNGSVSDFRTAEETMRRAIANLPDMKEHYGKYLAAILKQHAAVMDMLGKPADAEKLREQAAAL